VVCHYTCGTIDWLSQREASVTNEYIYRNDYTAKLRAIPDDCFRARRWHGDSNSYPHDLLRSQLDQLDDDQSIYRICFWTTLDLALKDRGKYEPGTTLVRCLKSEVDTAGFNASWDDGLDPEEAYLFWITEGLAEGNLAFSNASIPFSRFEALVDGEWVPFSNHISPPVQVVPERQVKEEPGKSGILAKLLGAVKDR